MTVAVLGCGPSGLLAAHAVREAGEDVDILSVYRPSTIGGAQFLHRAIPGVTGPEPDGEVGFVYVGTQENYAEKVYGIRGFNTSWGEWKGLVGVWNLRRAYAKLWAEYEGKITDTQLDHDKVQAVMRSYDLVISTVPLKKICSHPGLHRFFEQVVWITNEEFTGDDMIVYNGIQVAPWYRASKIFGVSGAEYPNGNDLNVEAARVVKPLGHECTCFPGLVKVGRYGKWEKGVLSHHAYEDTLKAVNELEMQRM